MAQAAVKANVGPPMRLSSATWRRRFSKHRLSDYAIAVAEGHQGHKLGLHIRREAGKGTGLYIGRLDDIARYIPEPIGFFHQHFAAGFPEFGDDGG